MPNFLEAMKRLAGHKLFTPGLIALFVLVINSPYLFGYVVADPVYTRAALSVTTEKGVLPGDYTIDPNNGFSSEALGKRVAQDLVHGKIAWWNHYEAIGSPLIGGLQAGFLVPLQLLLLAPNGLLYIHMALEIIAGLCTFYFLRRIGSNKTAATVGAFVFAANGTFAWLTNAAFNPVAFLPMLLLGIEIIRGEVKNKVKSPKGWAVVALSVAAVLYAGFPETGFIDTTFAFGWAIARSLRLTRNEQLHFYKKLILGGTLGLGLAAPLLIAFLSYLSTTELGMHSGGGQIVLPLLGVSPLFAPYIYGPIGASSAVSAEVARWWASVGGYLPISLVAAAITGLFVTKKQKAERWFLGAWIVVMVCATFGLLWADKALSVPGLSSIVFARYAPPSYIFAAIILMSLGMTKLFDKGVSGALRKRSIAGSAVLLLAVVILTVSTSMPYIHTMNIGHRREAMYMASILWLILVGATILTLFFAAKKRSWARLGAAMLIVIDVTIMFMTPIFSAPKTVATFTGSVKFLQDNLKTGERFYTMGPIQPNYGSYYGVASININDFPQKAYASYIEKKLNPNSSTIVFNGASVVQPEGQSPKAAFLQNMRAYEKVGVKYVVTFPGLFSGDEVTADSLNEVYSDDMSQVFELPGTQPYISFSGATCKYQIESFDALKLDCPSGTTLIRREQYAREWSARLDGRRQSVREEDGIFQATSVTKGQHEVHYVYEYRFMKAMYVITVASAAYIISNLLSQYLKYRHHAKTVRTT